MPLITCPACSSSAEPAAQVGAIAVCGQCGASLVVDDAGVRQATGADTTALSEADLRTLQRARGRIARADRRQR